MRKRGTAILCLAGMLAWPAMAAAQSQSPLPADDVSQPQDNERLAPPPVASDTTAPTPETTTPPPSDRKPPAQPLPPAATPVAGPPHTCELALDAPRFLREAARRGIFPKEISDQACEIDAASNQFFAGAERPCKILFAHSDWLGTNGKFANLRGTGQFSVAAPTSLGIVVTIPPQGGVAFERVVLKVQVRSATCPTNMQAADVLTN